MHLPHRLLRPAVAATACLLLAACTSAADVPTVTTEPAPTSGGPARAERIAQLAGPGPYATRTESYDLPGVRLPRTPGEVEVVGQVVGPVDPEGPVPVVLLLHGFWPACYTPGGNGGASTWPCPAGQRAIPSHLGYTYLQERLASHGFLTVSVAGNGVNVQNEEIGRDAGARARSALVRHHLDLLATGQVPALDAWPQADLSHVLLMGHSRGGEGVDRAAFDQPDDAAWDVRGVVLVGATAIDPVLRSRSAVVAITGDCDGDVGPGIGQLYVDRAPEDPALLRSSVLVGGANHNFFNTEWDPETSVSGTGFDDVSGDGQDPGPRCATGAGSRLPSTEQRETLARGMTMAAAALLAGDDDAAAVLDGRDALPPAGDEAVWIAAVGGRRTTVRPGQGLTAAAEAPSTAVVCEGRSSEAERPRLCGRSSVQGLTVHWPDEDSPWQPWDAVEVAWTAPGGAVRLDLEDPLDLSTAYALESRVAVDDVGSPVTLEIAVTDAAGATAVVGTWGPVEAMPGDVMLASRRWGQSMLLPLSEVVGVDLARIAAVTVTPRSTSGRVWLLDLSAVPD